MVWYDLIYSTTFWLILLGIAVLGYGIVRSTPLRKLPVFNNKRTLTIVAIAGLIFASGILGSMSFGSLASAADVSISDLQVTTNFAVDGVAGGSIAENSNVGDLIDARYTDAQANETSAVDEIDTGIITVTRVGSLAPTSCAVKAHYDSYASEKTPSDGVRYSIVEQDAMGQPAIYLKSGAAATTSAPKGSTMLAFADGSATATLGVLINVDEEGHDALSTYSYRDVTVDVCGKPYVFRVWRMD